LHEFQSKKVGGVGDASPLSKKVGGRRAAASPPHYTLLRCSVVSYKPDATSSQTLYDTRSPEFRI